MSEWIKKEFKWEAKDPRLGKRLRTVAAQLYTGMGKPIPAACDDWKNTKAAYRFLSNKNVSDADLLSGHFTTTKKRVSKTEGSVLVLHDTTEYSYKRKKPEKIGQTHEPHFKYRHKYTVCGLLMHSSIVITPEGLPLGLAAIKFWTRDTFKRTRSLKNKVNPTRIPIETKESYRWIENLRQSTALLDDPGRCIHIGDRECDIYEFFSEAKKLNTHFLVRACVNRRTDQGEKMNELVENSPLQGIKTLIYHRDGSEIKAKLELRYCKMTVLPPTDKKKKYGPLDVWMVSAKERDNNDSKNSVKQLHWRLLTTRPIQTLDDAKQALDMYAQRWTIETWHKVIKSGCKAEDSKLRSAENLTKLIALFCVLSWRVMWMTMLNRLYPNSDPGLALTHNEQLILDRLIPSKKKRVPPPYLHTLLN